MRIVIFGATGSVGQQAFKYLKKTNHKVVGMSYYTNIKIAKAMHVNYFYSPINDANVSSYEDLIIKSKPHLIINAVVGFEGLKITMLSLKHKIDLALANKESLVVAGGFINDLAKKHKVNIYPIDSEHTSLMHILKNKKGAIKRLYITASGGPFYNIPKNKLKNISFQQAIKHPTWKMGPKISIDSSTLMNKCFEIIECYWYFKTTNIVVLHHPQSQVHAIAQYKNSTFACIYMPSMEVPIKMVITKFKTCLNTIKKINLINSQYELKKINLSKPIKWGYQAIKNPHSSLGIILNAANECAFEKFKKNEIKYTDIIDLIDRCLKRSPIQHVKTIADVYRIDKEVRKICQTV